MPNVAAALLWTTASILGSGEVPGYPGSAKCGLRPDPPPGMPDYVAMVDEVVVGPLSDLDEEVADRLHTVAIVCWRFLAEHYGLHDPPARRGAAFGLTRDWIADKERAIAAGAKALAASQERYRARHGVYADRIELLTDHTLPTPLHASVFRTPRGWWGRVDFDPGWSAHIPLGRADIACYVFAGEFPAEWPAVLAPGAPPAEAGQPRCRRGRWLEKANPATAFERIDHAVPGEVFKCAPRAVGDSPPPDAVVMLDWEVLATPPSEWDPRAHDIAHQRIICWRWIERMLGIRVRHGVIHALTKAGLETLRGEGYAALEALVAAQDRHRTRHGAFAERLEDLAGYGTPDFLEVRMIGAQDGWVARARAVFSWTGWLLPGSLADVECHAFGGAGTGDWETVGAERHGSLTEGRPACIEPKPASDPGSGGG